MTTKQAIASSALPAGTRLGEFEITGVVGEGGFGIVYSAQDTTLERIVAIKEYLPSAYASRAADGSVRARSEENDKTFRVGLNSFINEAKMLARFAHPGLVEVFRFWEANGTAYMAMRYYRGVTLRDTIRNNPQAITEEWLCQTLDPILLALRELHAEQCFHRDIAPDNIMVLPNGKSVLMDFGAARRIIGGMTRALTTVLKPGYAPIEQYSDDGALAQGAWTDIYALGGVLYHSMTGKVPVQAISRMMADPLKDVATLSRTTFSPNLTQAVMKCLAVMPENRYQSIDELRTALGWVTTPVSSTVILTTPVNVGTQAKPSTGNLGAATVPRGGMEVVSTASMKANSVVSNTSLDPLANLGDDGANDILSTTQYMPSPQKTGAKPQKAASASATPAAAGKTSGKAQPLPAGAAAASKGTSPFLIIGAGLGLIVLAAAFMLFKRGPAGEAKPAAPVVEATPAATASAAPTAAPAASAATAPAETPAAAAPSIAPVAAAAGAATAAATDSAAKASAPVADGKAADPAEVGTLRVTVSGGWANISVNGEARGTTPKCCTLKLPPGSYSVEFTNPNKPPITKTVEVVAGKVVTAQHGY